MIKLAIDAMGCDRGSQVIVEAIKQFKQTYYNIEFYVVGKLEELKELSSIATIVEAEEVMGMEDGALEIMRRKKSSMLVAIDLVKDGICDGVVSAGSTGGFLTGATIKLKIIEGLGRAALVSPFPTVEGGVTTILDIGANTENTALHLVQFAKMGSVFSSIVHQVNHPKIFLLSNGAEEKKGSVVGKEAYQLLKSHPDFYGNIEGRDVLSGKADVVVCEGYPGNILLKSIEGISSMMNGMIKKAFKRSLFSKIGYLFARKGFDEMKKNLDYKKYGGALLLGVNGVAVKGHGSSDTYGFYNAIRVAYEMCEKDIVKKLREEINNG